MLKLQYDFNQQCEKVSFEPVDEYGVFRSRSGDIIVRCVGKFIGIYSDATWHFTQDSDFDRFAGTLDPIDSPEDHVRFWQEAKIARAQYFFRDMYSGKGNV